MLAAGAKADESGAFVTVLPLVKIRRMTYAMHCWVLFDAALGVVPRENIVFTCVSAV